MSTGGPGPRRAQALDVADLWVWSQVQTWTYTYPYFCERSRELSLLRQTVTDWVTEEEVTVWQLWDLGFRVSQQGCVPAGPDLCLCLFQWPGLLLSGARDPTSPLCHSVPKSTCIVLSRSGLPPASRSDLCYLHSQIIQRGLSLAPSAGHGRPHTLPSGPGCDFSGRLLFFLRHMFPFGEMAQRPAKALDFSVTLLSLYSESPSSDTMSHLCVP